MTSKDKVTQAQSHMVLVSERALTDAFEQGFGTIVVTLHVHSGALQDLKVNQERYYKVTPSKVGQ